MSEPKGSRTLEQIREHYEIEKELAIRLRRATREERRSLYSALYDELYRRVPHHPRNTRRLSADASARIVRSQMRFLSRFLFREAIFLEIGPGDCSLSFEAAKSVKRVYAVDVSAVATRNSVRPANVEIVTFNGIDIPLAFNSVNIAYSHQVMEHLHPDDAYSQLQCVYNVLEPGGVYVCLTPNRLGGPSDISGNFDEIPTGFHLREYTYLELSDIMYKSGFSSVQAYAGVRGRYVPVPDAIINTCECLLEMLPHAPRRAIAHTRPLSGLLGIQLVAKK